MTPQQIAVIVVVATIGGLAFLLLLYGRPRLARREPLPANFARGDPDSVLEGPRLAKVQIWGVASSIFITAFLVVYFVVEPFREASYAKKFLSASIERGEHEFRPETALGGANCAQCHGPKGEGGFAATDPSWPAPPLNNVMERFTRDEVTRIIAMGRPGTPMPTWAVQFGGALNDQKIEDVVNFIETLQVGPEKKWELPATITSGREVFARKCAVCHGTNAGGQGMGQPLPTFFAPDLTTEFYRLGLKVKREDVRLEIRNSLLAKRADRTEPTEAEIAAALGRLTPAAIMDAGEEAARNTITQGRLNTPMPAWLNRLLPKQIDAVVGYLKSIQRTPT